MNKSKRVFFSIADEKNMPLFQKMEKSFHYFHPTEELKFVGQEELNGLLKQDPQFFYRATPTIALNLFNRGYTEVIKVDADQIFCHDINHILDDGGDYDVGTVLNDTPLRVWDIETYYNCGFVVMRNVDFVKHWMRICATRHFEMYQYREQDILSILTSDYFNYKVKCYDRETNIAHGLCAKPFWPKFELDKDKNIYLKTDDGKTVYLGIIHFAGGNDPSKGNYRLRFKEEVVKRIDEILK